MVILPLIAVDIGNSSTKIGWFSSVASSGSLPGPQQVRDCATAQPLLESVVRELPPERARWRVASVQREGERQLSEWVLLNRPGDDFKILTYRDLPLEVRVEFPERVGLDRLAAAVAGKVLARAPDASRVRAAPQIISGPATGSGRVARPAIVVDAGTAITVDLVGADGAFDGGVILPGFRLTAQALSAGTNLLPLASFTGDDQPPPVVGKHTEGAIRSGLFWGAVGAVR